MINTTRNPVAGIGLSFDGPLSPSNASPGATPGGSLLLTEATGAPFNEPQSLYMAGRGTSSRSWLNVFAVRSGGLAGGTATIGDIRLTATSRVMVTRATLGSNPGFLSYSIIPGVSITVTSSNPLDDGSFIYAIIG